MAYVGRGIENLSDKVYLDNITASATATYNLTLNSAAFVPSSASALTVSLNGVIQKGGGTSPSYSVSGSQIIFSSALTSSDTIDFIAAERDITLQTPSAGSVGASQVAAGIITGQTELSSEPADTDEFLVSDAGTLKRIDYRLIKGGGKIAQVITAVDTSVRTTTSSSFVTGSNTATLNITPSATSSKIFVVASGNMHTPDGDDGFSATIFRTIGGTATNLGDTNMGLANGNSVPGVSATYHPTTMSVLDSPNTTSQCTYQWYFRNINQDSDGTATASLGNNITGSGATPTHITAFEVLA